MGGLLKKLLRSGTIHTGQVTKILLQIKWDVTTAFCKEPRVANMENTPSSPPGLGQPQEIGKEIIKLNLLRKAVLETRLSVTEHDNGTALLGMCMSRSPARHPPEAGLEGLSWDHGEYFSG